jgi:hypothetical protein
MGPCPAFQFVTINLFSLIEFCRTVNKRQTGKGWGVIFMCTATFAIHVEFAESYLTNCFLMTLMFMRGHLPGYISER